MRVERERACDDLVLISGCKASEYAGHLLEIARTFRRVPQLAAIAMARSSKLKGRIEAIVDASRCRTAPRAWLFAGSGLGVLGLVTVLAAQQPDSTAVPSSNSPGKPWFDARLRAFFMAKAVQARQLAAQANEPVAPEVWPYFDAGIRGDWQTATNLWLAMRGRAHQYEGTRADSTLDKVWSPILETDLAWEQFSSWQERYVLAYGNDIIKSIPPGSIYFGGTDPGRGVITAMCKSHADADPFFTLTQNALADGTYLDYLRAMYGSRIYTASQDDSKKCFEAYLADAVKRMDENKLKPGEQVTRQSGGKIDVHGQVAVMSINGLITKVIFDRNPDREFYIEESFPLDWMYPYLTPNGLIMKVNRQPLATVPEQLLQQDHQYWAAYVAPMLGNWLTYDTSVGELAAFVEKVYLNHILSSFTGDPAFLADSSSPKAFSKLRSSIAGVYAWRLAQPAKTYGPTSGSEYQRWLREADFAFKQSYALCPTSPEAVFRYANLLTSANRLDDALLVASTSSKLEPANAQFKSLVEQLKTMKARQ